LKKEENSAFAPKWVNLEDIMVSELIKTHKNKTV
jgi:hypothetical protein